MSQIKVSPSQLIKALDSLRELMPKLENKAIDSIYDVLTDMGSAETPTPKRSKELIHDYFDEIVCGRMNLTPSDLDGYSNFNSITDHLRSDNDNIEDWIFGSTVTQKKIKLKDNYPVQRKKRFEVASGGGSKLVKDPHVVNLPSAFLFGYKKWDFPGGSGSAPYRLIPGRDLIISSTLLSLENITRNSINGLKNHIESKK